MNETLDVKFSPTAASLVPNTPSLRACTDRFCAAAIFSAPPGASPLPCSSPYLSASPRPPSLPLTHTHPPTSSSTSSSNSDSFRYSSRDTCDTHHIHSLTLSQDHTRPVFTPNTHFATYHVLRRRIRWWWLRRWPWRRWRRIRRRVRLPWRIRLAELLFQWVCPTVYVL